VGPLLALAIVAAGVEPQAAAPVVVEADWAKVAPRIDVATFIQRKARAARRDGAAKIRCEVTLAGKAENCVVIEETPEGSAFGAALVELSTHLNFVPKTVDGEPVEGGTIVIPMRFSVGR
jgi:protein TonB